MKINICKNNTSERSYLAEHEGMQTAHTFEQRLSASSPELAQLLHVACVIAGTTVATTRTATQTSTAVTAVATQAPCGLQLDQHCSQAVEVLRHLHQFQSDNLFLRVHCDGFHQSQRATHLRQHEAMQCWSGSSSVHVSRNMQQRGIGGQSQQHHALPGVELLRGFVAQATRVRDGEQLRVQSVQQCRSGL